MTFSSLISGTVAHHGKHRGKGPVNRIVIHHWAGTSGGDAHLQNPKSDVSATYILYSSGKLIGQVPEEYRPWTTGPTGDAGSVTVETQNTAVGGNWPIAAAAKEKLAQLIADLATRYKWKEIKRGTTVRVHQDFSATACPGPDMMASLPSIISRANELWKKPSKPSTPAVPKTLTADEARKYVGKLIDIEAWWNYTSAADASALKNKVRVMPAGRYKVSKVAGSTPHLVKTDAKSSGWVHGSVLVGRKTVAEAVYHTVVKGDTLWDLARKYGTTVEKIQKLSKLTGSLITPGQKLRVK